MLDSLLSFVYNSIKIVITPWNDQLYLIWPWSQFFPHIYVSIHFIHCPNSLAVLRKYKWTVVWELEIPNTSALPLAVFCLYTLFQVSLKLGPLVNSPLCSLKWLQVLYQVIVKPNLQCHLPCLPSSLSLYPLCPSALIFMYLGMWCERQ